MRPSGVIVVRLVLDWEPCGVCKGTGWAVVHGDRRYPGYASHVPCPCLKGEEVLAFNRAPGRTYGQLTARQEVRLQALRQLAREKVAPALRACG